MVHTPPPEKKLGGLTLKEEGAILLRRLEW